MQYTVWIQYKRIYNAPVSPSKKQNQRHKVMVASTVFIFTSVSSLSQFLDISISNTAILMLAFKLQPVCSALWIFGMSSPKCNHLQNAAWSALLSCPSTAVENDVKAHNLICPKRRHRCREQKGNQGNRQLKWVSEQDLMSHMTCTRRFRD